MNNQVESLFKLNPDKINITYDGIYRAKVIDNKDEKMFGRVKVYLPDFMSNKEINIDKDGLWALPANNPIGGRNEETNKHHGSCYIPIVGSWVWIFFENGRIDRPYYVSALDIQAKKVPPENQLGDEYYNKWTVLRSPKGRVMVISDDSSDERVEITGKKRKYNPESDNAKDSVYTIDDNQTTILIDERTGKEKILIKDYKGNFICIEQDNDTFNLFMNGDMKVQIKGKTNLTFEDDVIMHCKKDVKMKIDGDMITDVSGKISTKSNDRIDIQSNSSDIHMDGNIFYWKTNTQTQSVTDIPEEPNGDRDD